MLDLSTYEVESANIAFNCQTNIVMLSWVAYRFCREGFSKLLNEQACVKGFGFVMFD